MSINKENLQKQIELFHGFSKSPTYDNQAFANAVNKSGHTVTTTDIWSEEIPYINADFTSTDAVPEAINANSVKNDILLIGAFTVPFNEKTAYKRNDTPFTTGASFTSLWTQVGTFSDCLVTDEVSGQKVCLQNKSGKNVIRYYENKTLELLTAENNSQATGNNQSARLRSLADSSQFVE